MTAPRRYELAAGTILFRFGQKDAAPMAIAKRMVAREIAF
jgi:hypothetical protein